MNVKDFEIATLLMKLIGMQNELIKNSKNQKCDFIYFSFGNGSNREVVCNDPEIITEVRELVTKRNIEKLEKLNKEFKEL